MSASLIADGRKPRLLDLFCGGGGAGTGYARAGFEVVGVDDENQIHYPFDFIRGDALALLDSPWFDVQGFDAIHASPPCQAFTALKSMWNAKEHADLLAPTRERLDAIGLPYIIENVEGAPMRDPITLCGTMFGLGLADHELRRHRLFEINWPLGTLIPPCAHGQKAGVIGVYGQHGRDRRRGHKTFFTVADGRVAMDIDWMTGDELSQAIPPAYTEFLGSAVRVHLSTREAEVAA